LARAEAADAVLLLLDATEPPASLPSLLQEPTVVAWNKADKAIPPDGALAISARTGAGINELVAQIGNIVRQRLDWGGEPTPTRERHRHALSASADAINRSIAAAAPEIIAEEIRIAMRELGRITGRVDVEELLDVVFRDFCIGK
jgi:tRNA modification GTPase